MKGLFLTFEGVDCCGKSTQAELLRRYLEKTTHKEVIITEEPGGTPLGKKLRQLILHPERNCYPGTMAEIYLYMADRLQHIQDVIVPNLDAGNIVMSSRFIDSTFAYQGHGRGVDLNVLEMLNAFHGFAWPDKTFLLNISGDVHRQRIAQKQHLDIMEQETLAFNQRVRDGFLACAERYPDRIVVIDGEQRISDVHDAIVGHVDALLKHANN